MAGAPARNSSASAAAKFRAPTADSPIPAAAMVSPFNHRATPAAPTGQSPTRRPTFSYALPSRMAAASPGRPPSCQIVIWISVRISPGATTVS